MRKKIDKKLTLNKKILVLLEQPEMKVARAGGTPWVDNQTTPAQQCP